MSEKLISLFREIAVDKLFYPLGALSTHQDDLMYELANVHENEGLSDLFKGTNISFEHLCDEEIEEIFTDWMMFNDWVIEEKVTGYIAVLNTPIIQNATLDKNMKHIPGTRSFGYCHVDLIYFETTKEMEEKCRQILKYWEKFDTERAPLR